MHKIKKNRSPNFDLIVANRIKNLLTEHLSIGKGLIVALKNNNQRLANELNDKWYKKMLMESPHVLKKITMLILMHSIKFSRNF